MEMKLSLFLLVWFENAVHLGPSLLGCRKWLEGRGHTVL